MKMTYYVVYTHRDAPVILEAFLSRDVARQFTQTIASWFERPLRIIDSRRRENEVEGEQ
jgi:hypothetical protein